MVASEALPFAKTGGLADVVGSLPRALARLGHHVDLVMPRYRGVPVKGHGRRIRVPLGSQVVAATCYSVTADGVRTVLVDHPRYFDREHLYGTGEHDYPDNPERFAFLSRAALEWAAAGGTRFDAIHGHDWQCGLLPVYLHRDFASHPVLGGTPTVFTIHNLAYQGLFDPGWLPLLGLSLDLMRIDGLEFWGRMSFLKAGVIFSTKLTTVSPRYAEEIQTPEYGCGFEGILRQRAGDLVGILNGIDYDLWNPARDPHLPEPYSASWLEGKSAAKRAVLADYGLPPTPDTMARPLVGMISRLVDQKGFDLIAKIADELPRLNARFVVLGSGERRYEELWLDLASSYPDRIRVRIGYDEALAHRIEGGADLFLMPSRFEPCGLNQMYSLRYGTIPVVRATGGLFDTVSDLDPKSGEGTGFTFSDYSAGALLGTLRRALDIYKNRALWRRMQVAGMRQDFSWDASAQAYVTVYGEVAR